MLKKKLVYTEQLLDVIDVQFEHSAKMLCCFYNVPILHPVFFFVYSLYKTFH